jgi:hypothetical protein
MLNLLFWLTLILPLPFWLLMIFMTNHPITRRITGMGTAFILLGILYIFVIVGAVVNAVNAMSAGTAYDFATLQGWTALMAMPAGTLAVLVHMTIMDLAGGHWIYNQAERVGAPRIVTVICLILAFILGPLGMFVFSLWNALTTVRKDADLRESERNRIISGA